MDEIVALGARRAEPRPGKAQPDDPDLLRRQVTLMGSWTFSTVGQKACTDFIADRGIDVDALFTHRWTLEQADEAYRIFDAQTSGKGVFLL